MSAITKEEKLAMMLKGFWYKCALPDCPNPASRNEKGSFCSRKHHITAIPPDNTGKKYRLNKKKRLKRSRIMKRMWKSPIGDRLREERTRRITGLAHRENMAYKKKLSHRKKQVIGLYESPKGTYQGSHSVPYRSEFAKEVYQRIDANPTIVHWEYLPIAVPYYKNGSEAKSFALPDIAVEYTDGRKKILDLQAEGYKAEKMLEFQALDNWCSTNGYLYEIWTKESLL